MIHSRRDFLKFMGVSAAVINSSSLSWADLLPPGSPLPFTSISGTTKDDLVLAPGFEYQILIKWKDAINDKEFFGANNDFLAYTPFKDKNDEGVLWVNHESVNPMWVHERLIDGPRSKDEVAKEQLEVGGSLLHIKKENKRWKVVPNSQYNRRITAQTIIPFQKGYKIFGANRAEGTLGNCAGGFTPWNTVLTGEENYQHFYGDVTYRNKKREFVEVPEELQWYKRFPLPPEHYGWVVEVDPLSGSAVKRCALGRFEHEGATVHVSKRGFPVVYMGQDRKFGFIFKFISSRKNSLENGTLYAADTVKGRWLPLDLKKNKILQKHFNSQHDVLTYAYEAAKIIGATAQDRPEDVEINPSTGEVFITLTNNFENNNPFGCIFKIAEKDGDHESLEFHSEVFLRGGINEGFASPDNMVFDNKGNLWVTGDMDDKGMAHGVYKGLGNNGLFFIPMHGDHAGKAFQVASAPVQAEFTGPMFSKDYKTLFLSVQHPGDKSTGPKSPTSHWPDGAGKSPRSAVVTISGPSLDKITQA